MFIDANKIIELIEIAKECDEKLPEDQKRIHVLDIAATLQKLIDDEASRLEELAEQFSASPDDIGGGLTLRDEEYGRLETENAAIEKELEVDYNWPYGV